jgi:hypothetical protein
MSLPTELESRLADSYEEWHKWLCDAMDTMADRRPPILAEYLEAADGLQSGSIQALPSVVSSLVSEVRKATLRFLTGSHDPYVRGLADQAALVDCLSVIHAHKFDSRELQQQATAAATHYASQEQEQQTGSSLEAVLLMLLHSFQRAPQEDPVHGLVASALFFGGATLEVHGDLQLAFRWWLKHADERGSPDAAQKWERTLAALDKRQAQAFIVPSLLRYKRTSAEKAFLEDVIFWRRNVSQQLDSSGISRAATPTIAALLYDLRLRSSCIDLARSDAYVRSLSDDDRELLALWTHACNQLQERAEPVMVQAAAAPAQTLHQTWLRFRLAQLFAGAPASTRDLRAFRGYANLVDDDDEVSMSPWTRIKSSPNPIAVTYEQNVARRFYAYGGCIVTLRVVAGTRFLALDTVSVYEGEESEVLLEPGTRLTADATEGDEMPIFSTLPPPSLANPAGDNAMRPPPPYQQRTMLLLREELEFLWQKVALPASDEQEAGEEDEAAEEEAVPAEKAPASAQTAATKCAAYATMTVPQRADFLTALFRMVRTWQLVQCGFGPVRDAIDLFWRSMGVSQLVTAAVCTTIEREMRLHCADMTRLLTAANRKYDMLVWATRALAPPLEGEHKGSKKRKKKAHKAEEPVEQAEAEGEESPRNKKTKHKN